MRRKPGVELGTSASPGPKGPADMDSTDSILMPIRRYTASSVRVMASSIRRLGLCVCSLALSLQITQKCAR